jgi:hypothetical protein
VRVVGVAGTCVAVSTCPGVLLGVAVCAITQYTIMMISCSCAHSVVCWYQEYLQGVLVKCCFQGGPLAEHVCNACSHTGRGGGAGGSARWGMRLWPRYQPWLVSFMVSTHHTTRYTSASVYALEVTSTTL